MNKRWLTIGGGAAVIILAFIIIFTVVANKHKPNNTVNAFNEAVENKDIEILKELLETNEKDVEINKESVSAFVNYLQANNESFQVIKEGLKRQVDDKDFTTSNEQVSLLEDGKTIGMFPNYKVRVKTVNLQVKGLEDEDTVKLAADGFKESLNTVDDKEDIYGPFLPGEYNIEAMIENTLGSFTKEEKIDLWGGVDVSFLIDSEKLARDNEDVQKEIINAVNEFNGDMSIYVTSGFDADEFMNITEDLKDNLSLFDGNFELNREYVDKIESQFLKSTVNMDELDLSQFDGDWRAEVTMLVSYDERIKLKEEANFEDLSYIELRNFSLIYDHENQMWMIDDFDGKGAEESDADNWDNKVEIEIENPPIREWSEEESFI